MPNSMKVMIKKLAHKGCISAVECYELLTKLDGHDKEIRALERRKFVKWLVNKGVFLQNAEITDDGKLFVLDYEKEMKTDVLFDDVTECYCSCNSWDIDVEELQKLMLQGRIKIVEAYNANNNL